MLSPKHPKKTILGTLKDGTKLVGAGLMLGARTELAGHISRKAQEADNGALALVLVGTTAVEPVREHIEHISCQGHVLIGIQVQRLVP